MSNKMIIRKEEIQATPPTITGLEVLEKVADYVVKSRLFGVRSKEEAVTLMLLAQAEGIHPMNAIREYYIVGGRPALKADAMLARFQKAGGRVKWHVLNDEKAKATFYHPQGGEVTIEWDIERARKAGLLREGSSWLKYPRAMLRARVISEGVRTVYPAVIVGIYTPEEIMTEGEISEAEVVEPVEMEVGNTEGVSPEEPAAKDYPKDSQPTQSGKIPPASDKQKNFISRLLNDKRFTIEDATREVLGVEKPIEELNAVEASKVIDFLQNVKRLTLAENQKKILRNRLKELNLSEKTVERIVENINEDDFKALSQAIKAQDRDTIVQIFRKYGIRIRKKDSSENKNSEGGDANKPSEQSPEQSPGRENESVEEKKETVPADETNGQDTEEQDIDETKLPF